MKNHKTVLKPLFGNLKEKNLVYKDILTYITIRSFYNSISKFCYPSLKDISTLSGLSTKVVKSSIKRLENAGYLNTQDVSKSWARRIYTFENDLVFQKVSLDLLLEKDLSPSEKAFFLLVMEYAQDESYDSPQDIAQKTGMSYTTCFQLYKSILTKGYISEEVGYDKDLKDYFAWISICERPNSYHETEAVEGSTIKSESTEGDCLLKLI